MKFRACYYKNLTGDEVCLTQLEDAARADSELFEIAVEEAYRADIIGDAWPRLPEWRLRSMLVVDDWTE